LQARLPASSLGNNLIHSLYREDVFNLVSAILLELLKVWRFNSEQTGVELGIDGQISNWALRSSGQKLATPGAEQFFYLDNSTPFIRLDGVEQMDAELFLRSAPPFLSWILRLFFLKDVVARYYDLHRVLVDLIANFYKEQLPELIPDLVDVVNNLLRDTDSYLHVEPIQLDEVAAYYREDALIWRLYLSMRRIDQFLRRRVLRRSYPYILPGKIKR